MKMQMLNSSGKRPPRRNVTELASSAVGVSQAYIYDAQRIHAAAPHLLAQVRAGSKTITQAKRETTAVFLGLQQLFAGRAAGRHRAGGCMDVIEWARHLTL